MIAVTSATISFAAARAIKCNFCANKSKHMMCGVKSSVVDCLRRHRTNANIFWRSIFDVRRSFSRMYNFGTPDLHYVRSLQDLRECLKKFVFQYLFRGSVRINQASNNFDFSLFKEVQLKKTFRQLKEQPCSQSSQISYNSLTIHSTWLILK